MQKLFRLNRSLHADGFSPFAIAAIPWLLVSIIRITLFIRNTPGYIRLDTDDALRLVQIRDLLAGQSWFDLTQYRMTPPLGVAMHWSRIVDAPVGGLILFFRLFTDHANAEIWAAALWPMLLLLPTLLGVTAIAQRLAGKLAGLAAVFIGIGSSYMLGFFQPGAIDHHNMQLALTAVATAVLLDIESSTTAAVACAALNAVSLGIGLETLPYVLTTCAIVAGYWIAQGAACARPVRNFGFALAVASAVLFFGFVADHERYSAACDTFSGFYAALAIAGGAGLAGLTFANGFSSRMVRLGAILGLGLCLVALALIFAPQCMHGPYSNISPELDRIWLSRVEEVRSPFRAVAHNIGFFFSTYFYAFIGVVMTVAALLLVERPNRIKALGILALATVALAVASVENRAVSFAILFVIPGIAVAIERSAARWISQEWLRAAAMIAALWAFTEAAFFYVGNHFVEGTAQTEMRTKARELASRCYGHEAAAQLAALPRGRVAAFISSAPAILLYTDDSVMAGSYHRDGGAILDLYKLFDGGEQASAAILRGYGIDYVMTCRFDSEYPEFLKQGGRNGFLSRLDRGDVPSWLIALPRSGQSGEVRLYEVNRDRLSAQPRR